MSKLYAEEQNVDIAKKQYEDLEEVTRVTVDNPSPEIGYVSKINDRSSGEQSFVLTKK